MKGHIIVDFIIDHSLVKAIQNYIGEKPWKLYFDGSRHKDGTGIRILIISPTTIPTNFKFRIEGHCSNNEAEYEALIIDLRILLDLGGKVVEIKGDSKLVVEQLRKEYKCINESLMMYLVTKYSLF